jgi:hypothetical protein
MRANTTGWTEGELAAVTVEVTVDERTLELRVLNTNADLPLEFDFDSTNDHGIGLDLVKALLPREGAKLSITRDGSRVQTSLILVPPSLVFDDGATRAG